MSFVQRQAAHCDQCSHEWLIVGASEPTHCAKCKSRKWNKSVVEAKPDRHDIIIQALRDVCVGKRISMPAEIGSMDKSKPLAPDARWPDEDPELERPLAESFAKYSARSFGPKPGHDPKTCRVYKCGMCSK